MSTCNYQYNNKEFYGLYQYNVGIFDIYGEIIHVTEDKEIIIKKIDDIYNGRIYLNYENILLFKVKNIDPKLLNYKILNELQQKLHNSSVQNSMCNHISIIKNKKKHFNFYKFDIGKHINNYNDILSWYNTYFNNYNNIRTFDHRTLKYFIYGKFNYIRHYNIVCEIKKILGTKNKNIIKQIYIDANNKYKWYNTKKNMINCILQSIKMK